MDTSRGQIKTGSMYLMKLLFSHQARHLERDCGKTIAKVKYKAIKPNRRKAFKSLVLKRSDRSCQISNLKSKDIKLS